MSIQPLLQNNRHWAKSMASQQPGLLPGLAVKQKPKYLWIGCVDSRVPANQILQLPPGDLLVHRNIANQIKANDVNGASVIQFAVDVLQVEHIIVCGHTHCGGVDVAMKKAGTSHCGQWLDCLVDQCDHHHGELSIIADAEARWQRMCELNVHDQIDNLRNNDTVKNAWARQQPLHIHGWMYHLEDGLIRDLAVSQNSH